MRHRFFIVDDSLLQRTFLKSILTSHNYEVVGEATNGSEAISMYSELQPDLVILDINLPDITGVQVLNEILCIDGKAKIIMVTSMGQSAYLKECLLLGARDFVIKPVAEHRLLKSIEAVMSSL